MVQGGVGSRKDKGLCKVGISVEANIRIITPTLIYDVLAVTPKHNDLVTAAMADMYTMGSSCAQLAPALNCSAI
jgi:hypothetical protein